jgi:hypothetical protein
MGVRACADACVVCGVAAQREKKPARKEELKEKLTRVQQTLKRDGDVRAAAKRVRILFSHPAPHCNCFQATACAEHTRPARNTPQEAERRKREKEAVVAGKKPFYLKKCTLRKLRLSLSRMSLRADTRVVHAFCFLPMRSRGQEGGSHG